LTKLEVHGFKAFADQTVLAFDEGVTAIVGPNGCGKSNVSDAVRWVLGEQRARVMRGAKMEDVIFHGSSARRPVNMAQVSMTFDNSAGELPIAYREVVITRRLLRTGESDYFLNGAPCRLRDIQDLVRGTGLGADSGVVIESKMIDALLSDRPDDRRELFEEAAGVGLYRDRRRSAERRLEETTGDLGRLDDLISEVQSQVRSLARQRRKAERHAELTARRFQVELTLTAHDMGDWQEELSGLEGQLASLREAVPAAATAIAAAVAIRDDAHSERMAADAARSEVARLAAEQREQLVRLEGDVNLSAERQRSTLARRQRAEEERREHEQFDQRVRDDRTRAVEERAALAQEVTDASAGLRARQDAENAAREAVAAVRGALDGIERTTRDQRDQMRRAELDREAAIRERDETGARLEGLATDRESLEAQAANADRDVARAAEAVERAQVQVREAEGTLATARAAAQAAREVDGAQRGRLARAEQVFTSLTGRVQGLESLERQRTGLAPAAQRLLAARDVFGEGAILGPLTDFLTVDAATATLIERFLGPSVHAIVVRDGAVTAAVREWHHRERAGALLLLPQDALAARETTREGLSARVESTSAASGWVASLLGAVTVLDNGEAFVDARGAVFLPGADDDKGGPLRRRAELAEARQALAEAERERGDAQDAAEDSRAALQAAERAVQLAAEAMSAAQQDARRALDGQREAERARERMQREAQGARDLVARLEERLAELAQRDTALATRAQELAAFVRDGEAQLEESRAQLTHAEQEHDAAREQRTTWQVALAQAQARLSVAEDREARLGREHETAAARLEQLARELLSLVEADQALAEQMAAAQLSLDAQRSALADADRRLAEAEQRLAAATMRLEQGEQGVEAARQHQAVASDRLHHAELRFSELSGKREAVRERLETEWRKPLDVLLDGFVPLELEPEVLRAEAAQLREQIDGLGPVNPLAIEEHEEEQKRLDFLSTQRDDLHAAKLSLQQAIKEIDTTARELFLATFAQARENFRRIFLTLFGGGECDLRLENPDAPLDCDIEVHASPRGKKTQRIHLLSSGERALVALSLLFGIFLTKPSPFCLLDEVDAPLDDQNIGRFVRLLNEFKTNTQFIVITHNPRTTTEAADAVYGVTMQEPGVSSVVSVRLRGKPLDDDTPGEGQLALAGASEG
jgi:chromosome segregation protein